MREKEPLIKNVFLKNILSFRLLEKFDPEKARKAAPNCARLFTVLDGVLGIGWREVAAGMDDR